jgi:toxin ParE1/3/4
MRIIWSPEAISDLTGLRDFIAKDNPSAAHGVAEAILNTIELTLLKNPELGSPGRVPGTRELVIPNTPVIVPYRIQSHVLQILGVYHHSRRWPDRL